MTPHVVVVGGGLVGLATAAALRRAAPGVRLTLLEKEPAVGAHQSGHNSGVLHAGLAYAPGSLKARLAVEGARRMRAFCEAHGVAHEVCGKLVVATTPAEAARLDDLEARGRANGLQGIRRLDAGEAREREPHVGGIAWLLVPEEGIVDYPGVARVLAAGLVADGVTVRTGAAVRSLTRTRDAWRVGLDGGETVEASFVVTCAGLHADRLARMAGVTPVERILPFRGEYFTLRPDAASLVRHLIYPAPDPSLPFLGVHCTRLVTGGVECGPNAVLALAREGYDWGTVSARDLGEALGYRGLWRFIARYPRTVAHEVWQSLSRARFAAALRRLVPAIGEADLAPGGAGVRAQLVAPDGRLVHDFVFADGPGAVHVLNAPSPAATACLAIGDSIAARVLPRLEVAVAA